MSIYNSNLWIEDIEKVINNNPWITDLVGKKILITGIGGLVCSPVADIIIRYNETHDNKIFIIAAGRSKDRILNRFGEFANKDYFQFIQYDATKIDNDIPVSADYIIHGASNSSPDLLAKEPVETILSNISGLHFLLKYAKESAVSRVLYISSSEVYGLKEQDEPYQEGQYGYIDLLKSRNAYSVGKRAAETLCVSYADEYGVDSVIVRPGHIYGPCATIKDKHVSSQWAYAAAKKQEIVMKSDGSQIRSYVYCLDAAAAILTVLLKGEKKKAYNISNPNSVISIKQMAMFFSKAGNVDLRIECPSETEKKAFNPMNNSSLDSSSLLALGWTGCFDAVTGMSHTVKIIEEAIC